MPGASIRRYDLFSCSSQKPIVVEAQLLFGWPKGMVNVTGDEVRLDAYHRR